ncbi:MAG TPA: hypothetical protein VMZ22_03130 [Acidimicrobiales bacterium]|nr:hypothetical protein [Acidimicrobiales bacterium]
MRLIRSASAVALVVAMCAAVPARGQDEAPPLEDVTLRGRVLRPDGSPLANTAVRVDAKDGFSLFAFFAFAFTGGLSALSCFGGPSELCPSGGKSFFGTTDANGRYSFTFRDAHRRGEQTNTDYTLSVGMASVNGGDKIAVSSYELELLDAVHNAPDLVMWDPAEKVEPKARGYRFTYARRPDSRNTTRIQIADQELHITVVDNDTVDARDIEDSAVQVVPNASRDVSAAGTTYHQRFVAAPAAIKGEQVPLSRGAPCTAARTDDTRVPGCGYTDGDLITAAVAEPDPCFEGSLAPRETSPCQPSVKSVTIDLGAVKEVGEVRTRCVCSVRGSDDGVAWRRLPGSGEYAKPKSMRYVSVAGESLGSVPEMSVWAPWPDGPTTPLDSGSDVPTPDGEHDASRDMPWLLGLIALIALLGAVGLAFTMWQRQRS